MFKSSHKVEVQKVNMVCHTDTTLIMKDLFLQLLAVLPGDSSQFPTHFELLPQLKSATLFQIIPLVKDLASNY